MSGEPINVTKVLCGAGANPNAPEGSQAWALAQVEKVVVNLVRPARHLCSGLPHKRSDSVAVIGSTNTHELFLLRDALSQVTYAGEDDR